MRSWLYIEIAGWQRRKEWLVDLISQRMVDMTIPYVEKSRRLKILSNSFRSCLLCSAETLPYQVYDVSALSARLVISAWNIGPSPSEILFTCLLSKNMRTITWHQPLPCKISSQLSPLSLHVYNVNRDNRHLQQQFCLIFAPAQWLKLPGHISE